MRRLTLYAAMTGGFGALAQVLPILESLDRKRYRIVCSIAHGAAHAIERLGFEFIPYPQVAAPNPALVTPKGRMWCDLDQYWGRFGFADPQYLHAVIQSRLKIVDELRPDVLLTHFCPPTEMIARIRGIPLVCVTQSCWHPRGKSISWWQPARQADYVRVTPAINSVLAAYAVAGIGRCEELNQGDLTFIPSFPEFDPVEDDSVFYMGPPVWSGSGALVTHRGPAATVPSTGSDPMVLVYTGHLLDSGGRSGVLILEAVIQALANERVKVLITTGLGQQVDGATDLPKNIELYDWLDLWALLPRCAVFIHHGGHGSCMAALMSGAGSLMIPTFQEREFNARQGAALGLGAFLEPDSLDPRELKHAVLRSVTDRQPALRARHWRDELARRNYGGGGLAAQVIGEAFAS